MSESGGLDVSKVISVIMENPKLIEEISRLSQGADSTGSQSTVSSEKEDPTSLREEISAAVPTSNETAHRKSRRNELLCALKPYLNGERAKAIDSMMTIADILEVVKAR